MADQTNTTNQIREVLKLLRVHHDLKLSDLAKMLEDSVPYVAGYLEGEGEHPPTVAELEKYSDYFNIPVSSIMFIAEHLESARQGKAVSCHCRAADLVLKIERTKAELKNDMPIRKQ